ncbi:hypothetical protein [Tenacibaculum sp. IB213877]|uniref:hypothetical protein n=1 Tax=Tenacibaculum sp. IB213877 TaxID=3097351 RepID=UPI002A59B829|nr:hypothetical protein [Tenacibaculum sp. IB213877]MDY0780926.1 hypothetical protein [Tenacibaculum sp. IB213877]
MAFITHKEIFNQLKADLIGKDSYRGITLTYAWLANQFGHIALGFIPSFILFHALPDLSPLKKSLTVALIVTIFWFLFELYNFLGPLLIQRISSSKNVYLPVGKKYIFKPIWKNIAFDTFTDVCFFALGAYGFSYLKAQDELSLLILVILMLYLSVATRYWFLVKMYQQYANYPFQFRLSQWNYTISDYNKNIINEYLHHADKGKHLLIFGSQLSGKTSLGVGMLNELSIKRKLCFYSSATKLYTYFFVEDNALFSDWKLWTWKQSDFLIIDDVNPGSPIEEELISPKQFLSFLDPTQSGYQHNDTIKTIANKNVIWILGNCKDLDFEQNTWVQMLNSIGVKKHNIKVLNLL